MRGGLGDVERTARFLYVTHAAAAAAVAAPTAASVFRAAGEHGLIPYDAAGRLAEAATMWRTIRGIVRLVADDDLAVATAGPKVEAVIARASGSSDFDDLAATVRDTAARAAADIDALAS